MQARVALYTVYNDQDLAFQTQALELRRPHQKGSKRVKKEGLCGM